MPVLSVVIPSHNRPDLLERCLGSVQTHAPARTEVLVVDDASPRGEVSRVASTFAGVRVLRRPRRGGFCKSANLGLKAAAGPIVEVLNDDTEVTAGWAENALRCFDDPRVGAVAPLVHMGDSRQKASPRIDSAGDRYYLGGIAAKHGHGQEPHAVSPSPRSVFGASASSAFYRRQVILDLGGFPESFGAYFEDVDLSFRLRWAGWQIVHEPASRIWHRVSASHGKTGWRLLAQQSRNEERVFWRNMPADVLRRAVPLHLGVLLAKAWRRLKAGELLPFLWGRLSVVLEIPSLWRHRRTVHQLGHARNVEETVEDRYWG